MRIVSLCPSTTETLFALGVGDRVVGVTRFCIHPGSETAKKAKVGGTKDPKLERILELTPDLVLMNEEENRLEDCEALRAAGLAVETAFPKQVAQVPAHVRWLGTLVGAVDIADRIAKRIEAARSKLAELRAAKPDARFRFAYLIWREPWMAVGPDTYVDDLLSEGGGVNVVGPDRYPEVELGALPDPRVLLLPDEPFPFSNKHLPELRSLVSPSIALELVGGDDLCWHGVRTERGLIQVADLFRRFAG